VIDPDRLVDVGRSQDGSGFDNGSYANYLDIRARNTVFSGIYAYKVGAEPMSLGAAGGAERIFGDLVSTNYFTILGARPHSGRLFAPTDGHNISLDDRSACRFTEGRRAGGQEEREPFRRASARRCNSPQAE
jgi:hypothetical protein